CAISSMARNRLDSHDPKVSVDFYFPDILSNRQLSGKIAHDFGIRHESPQILLIKNGICTYHESHSGIQMEEILEQAGL
ncbi:MAG: DUF2847 family protein, partial [Bacteroidota bacterium]|nr:DUF2847 family protein [Bacteroidota bacterium]